MLDIFGCLCLNTDLILMTQVNDISNEFHTHMKKDGKKLKMHE